MVKKLFALASVSALAGLMAATGVAGCSSSEDSGGGSSEKDAGNKDSGKKTPATDGGDKTTDDDDDDTTEQCWKADEIDLSKDPYKAPATNFAACSDDAPANLEAWLSDAANSKATFEDVKAEITTSESAECAACLFGDDTGETWAPIVMTSETDALVNKGGCYAVVSGNVDCGAAYQHWYDCLTEACDPCADGDKSGCYSGAQKDACKAATEAVAKDCGAKITTYAKACAGPGKDGWSYTFSASFERQCTSKGMTVSDASKD